MANTASELWLKDIVAWMNNPSIPMYGRWNHPPPPGNPNSPGEGGVDITAPPGTPVYALGTGELLSADTFSALGFAHPGAVLSERVNVPGYGLQDIYYQHIDLLPGFQTCLAGDCGGRVIQAGQEIGTVGSVGETEVGFNPNWGSLYGPPNHPGSWPSDPRPLISALITGNAGGPTKSGSGCNPPWWCVIMPLQGASLPQCACDTIASGIVPSASGDIFSGVENQIAGLAKGAAKFAFQAGIVLLGLLLVIVAIVIVFKE